MNERLAFYKLRRNCRPSVLCWGGVSKKGRTRLLHFGKKWAHAFLTRGRSFWRPPECRLLLWCGLFYTWWNDLGGRRFRKLDIKLVNEGRKSTRRSCLKRKMELGIFSCCNDWRTLCLCDMKRKLFFVCAYLIVTCKYLSQRGTIRAYELRIRFP